jgi:alanyl-tRNA synthetase
MLLTKGFETMHTQDIRLKFLRYFEERGHARIASSSVVPHDDPTLLFINAGMNQFKDVFLGRSVRDYVRATTSQKCIRVGGKHNDLENVGHTSRHLTFFEMLGNFSFGDYFKAEAIKFAWEVSTEVFGFEADRIWPTVFLDDDEAFELWLQYVPAQRITRFGEKENFWAMGDVGPCGPCSELLYDRGDGYGSARSPLEDSTGERYLEFWNLVFMQYNRSADGNMAPLPKPSIDTGAGLERVVGLKMGVDSVFETDVLRSLIAQVENVSGVAYHTDDHVKAPAFRVIADHLRCLAFAIADGAQPSNVDRGYVLRKVLRRAVRYGRLLGMEEPFLAKVFPRLIAEMGSDYRQLEAAKERIEEILTTEEEAFIRTLKRGGNLLNQIMERAGHHNNVISGDDAFKLKDTYGMPLEEITLLAKDANLDVDIVRYGALEQEAKERSRRVQKTTQQVASESLYTEHALRYGDCLFVGYTETEAAATIQGLIVDGQFVEEMIAGQEGMVLLDQTPFYAEMGGQIGDRGVLQSEPSAVPSAAFDVANTLSPYKGIIAHVGVLTSGALAVGQRLVAAIDRDKRQRTANNHTATHLLHWALHSVLGEHIKQAGSVVDPYRLRFDFSHHKAVTDEELRTIEDLVNSKIRENLPVATYEIPYGEALKRSEIKQFFGEKYGSTVRVVDVDFSQELCGGTHTGHLGNIGFFRIAKESSIAAGVRRIEAVTGAEAEQLARQGDDSLNRMAALLKAPAAKLEERIDKLLEENRQLHQELKALKKDSLKGVTKALLSQVEMIQQLPVVLAYVDLSAEDLRACADELTVSLPDGIVIAAAGNSDKCSIVVRVGDPAIARGIKAGELVKAMAPIIEGSGGGKPNSAQAGGKATHKLPQAFDRARELIRAATHV